MYDTGTYRYDGGGNSSGFAWNYRARYYDPTTGRFLSEDPAKSGDNFYAYTRNNPITRTDPFGLWDTYTHHALIWNALRGCASDADIWQLQQESDFVDSILFQGPDSAYMHAMKASGQSAQSAIQDTNDWIQQNLSAASQMYQQYGDTASASNATSTWTTPFGDALHTIMDSTSPAHRRNGMPLSWPTYPNALQHGNEKDTIEDWNHMTPELMQQNINMIRQAYQQVTGNKCGCQQ